MRPPAVPTYQRYCEPCRVFHMSFNQNYYEARPFIDNMVDAHNPTAPRTAEDDEITQELERVQ